MIKLDELNDFRCDCVAGYTAKSCSVGNTNLLLLFKTICSLVVCSLHKTVFAWAEQPSQYG